MVYLIERYKYKSYLEIGWRSDTQSNMFVCPYKVVVDSVEGGTLRLPPDVYFHELRSDVKFDLIFLNGLQHSVQVDRDIHNALQHLNPNGTIIIHNCNPPTESIGTYPQPQGTIAWRGDVWRTIALWRTRSDVDICTLGDCGILRQRPNTNPYTLLTDWQLITWEQFQQHKQELLQLKSFDEVASWLN